MSGSPTGPDGLSCPPEGSHSKTSRWGGPATPTSRDVHQSDGVIYEVRFEVDGKLLAAGCYAERADAEARREELSALAKPGPRASRYWTEEIDTTGLFQLPSRPTPRERFRSSSEAE